MIYKISELLKWDCFTQTKTMHSDRWTYKPARPINWQVRTLKERLKHAYWAFTGKYDLIDWEEDTE